MTTDFDWIRQTLAHRETGRVPYNLALSPPVQRAMAERYGDDLATALALPVRMTSLKARKPLYADPAVFGPTAVDDHGVVWATSPIDRGSPAGPCLHEPTLAGYVFPDPSRPERFAHLAAWCRRNAGQYRIIWVGDLWERATFMRGMEPLLLDVVLHPAFVEELLEHLAWGLRQTVELLVHGYDFEAIAVSDDYGTQRGLLLSPASWRRLIRPHLATIYAIAHDHGRAVFHHTCGHVEPIVGDLVDLGLDILHPVQPEANDLLRMKRQYGRHLTFCGGVPTQRLLVGGTPDQVRAEVRRLKRQMGEGGGYILEPGITLQADVPLDNVVAMMEEARAPGR